MIIDCHTHLLDQSLCESVGLRLPPNMFSAADLAEKQQEAGIDCGIVSGPRLMESAFEQMPSKVVEVAKRHNDYCAEIIHSHGSHFASLGAVHPFVDDAMLKEMERAVTQLGLKGFIVAPVCEGEFIDSPRAFPFFEFCAKHNVTVFVHNRDSCVGCEHMKDYRLEELVGRPNEMGLLAAKLIFSGLMEKLPNLKLLLGRAGGPITMYAGRIQQGWELRHGRPQAPKWGPDNLKLGFMESLKRVHVDTQTFHPPAIACAVHTLGAERVLLGTDYPPVPRDLRLNIQDVQNAGLRDDEVKLVLGENAKRLFDIAM
jgi:predicted TIM-barrel fold metal-dependent hydrolase